MWFGKLVPTQWYMTSQWITPGNTIILFPLQMPFRDRNFL